MIYNEAISSAYGDMPELKSGGAPVSSKPNVTDADYKVGYITRRFAKKVNEDLVVEIDRAAPAPNRYLYSVVTLSWKITGPKDDRYNGKIVDETGVAKQNLAEIERVRREQGVDLSRILTNPLEFWRGR